jgi:hypothetical protein
MVRLEGEELVTISLPNRQDVVGGQRYRRGDLVTVRPLDEILATLDADGKFEGMPFMPEMVRFCGRTFKVHRRAERTCVEGEDGPRRMENTVLLEGLRCDGSAHEGCQRSCMLFWKEAWLRPASGRTGDASPPPADAPAAGLWLPTTKDERFYCQSTELAAATSELEPGDLCYYFADFRQGEASMKRMLYILWLTAVSFIWRRVFRCEYYCRPAGEQTKTATGELNLLAGELVEVRSAEEIRATLDRQGRNRGLSFEAEMLACCGRRFRVRGPVQNIIAETTGKMLKLSHTVTLEGATCEGIYIKNCPRAHYFYWREIWLKRVEPEKQ